MDRWTWDKLVPYTDLIKQAGLETGVQPALIAAVIAQETGGSFAPYSVTLPEVGLGLGQLQWRLPEHRAWLAGGPWWDPATNIRACARELADWARKEGLPGHPPDWRAWLTLRLDYAHGRAGRLRAGEVDPFSAVNVRRHDIQQALWWIDAIYHHPLDGRTWGGGPSPPDAPLWEEHSEGQLETVTLGGVRVTATRYFVNLMRTQLVGFVLSAGGERESILDWVARAAAGDSSLPGAMGDTRHVIAAPDRERALIVLLKTATILRAFCGVGRTLTVTSSFRPATWDAAHNPRVKVSQHAAGVAWDLALNVNGSENHSVVAAARTLAGWAVGPDFRELGGVGIYASEPRMLHVDGRARPGGRLARWSDGYNHVII